MLIKYFLRLFITTILLLSFVNTSVAQSKKKKSRISDTSAVAKENIISTFPFSFIGGSILLGYERHYANKKSIKFLAGIGAADRSRYYSAEFDGNTRNHVDNMSSFYFELQPRFYITENKAPMNGLYMAPILNFKQMNFDLTLENINFGSAQPVAVLPGKKASAYTLGYVIGYQAVLRSSLTLDFYAGGGMMRAMGDYKMVNTLMGIDSYRNGIVIHLGAAIGIAL